MARLLEEENASLRDELETLRDEQNQWLVDAEVARAAADRQIAELRAETHRHRA